MREKGQTEVAKTLETPVFSRGIEILTEKFGFIVLADSTENVRNTAIYSDLTCVYAGGEKG